MKGEILFILRCTAWGAAIGVAVAVVGLALIEDGVGFAFWEENIGVSAAMFSGLGLIVGFIGCAVTDRKK